MDKLKDKVAIVTGAGEKFFSAGWDLKAVNDGEAADANYGVGGFGGLQELPNMNKPIIAAVNGIACGGGLEIMISTDIIIAAEHSTFSLTEINVDSDKYEIIVRQDSSHLKGISENH